MVGVALCAYLVLLLVLNQQPFKQLWINEVKNILSEKLSTNVEIGDIEIGLFDRITINGFQLYDQGGETLLSVSKFSSRISLTNLIKGNIALRTVLLMDSHINLYQSTNEAEPNYSFLTKLFISEDDTSNVDNQITIGSLIIRRACIVHQKRWLDNTSNKLDINNLNLININANLFVRVEDKEHIKIRVRNFSCDEKSGFSVNKLQFAFELNQDTIAVKNLTLKLPHSQIKTKENITVINSNKFPKVDGELVLSQIHMQDLMPLFGKNPNLNYVFQGRLNCNAYPDGTSMYFNLKEHGERMKLAVMAQISTDEQVKVNLHELSLDSAIVAPLSRILPENIQLIKNIGTCSIVGDAYADLKSNNASTQMKLSSPTIGNLSANAQLENKQINLNISTQNTNLKSILESDILPEVFTSTGSAQATLVDSLFRIEDLHLSVHSAYNNKWYDLNNIETILNAKNSDFKFTIKSQTPHHAFNIDSKLKIKKNNISAVDFNANLENIDFTQIGYTDSIFCGKWSGMFKLNIPVISDRKYAATLKIDSLLIKRPTHTYQLNQCTGSLDYTQGQQSTLRLRSDDISIDIDGSFSHKDIMNQWVSTIADHIPSIVDTNKCSHNSDESSLSINVNIHDGAFIKKLLLLPIEVADGSSIKGRYNKNNTFSELSAHFDRLHYQESVLDKVSLHLKSQESGVGLLLQARKKLFNDDIQLVIGAQLHENLLETNVEWDGINHHKLYGSINTLTSALSENEILTSVLPTTIHIEDSIWNISGGEILVMDKEPSINNLTIKTEHQKLAISGGLSKYKQKSLQITLDNIDVGYILDKINFTSVLFDGKASGDAFISLYPSDPFLQTDLLVNSFHFNNTYFGEAHITGKWDDNSLPIQITGEFIENNVGSTNVIGQINPSEDSIDLHITSDKTNIEFLRLWVDNITKDISGRTTGNCRLFGTFSNLDLSGQMNINASLFVPSNGVVYNLVDTPIDISSGSFKLNNGKINSPKGGEGIVSAQLKHNNFKNFSYTLNLNSNKLLLYDKERTKDLPFYATTYASGTVQLDGKPGILNLNVDATPTDNSFIVYTESELLSTNEVSNDFIIYRNLSKGQNDNFNINTFSAIHAPGMDMNMRFNIHMNPAITLKVLMDEVTGDHLNLRGNGIISADYYNKGTFQLYGNYDIVGGNYLMSIQEFLKKNLEIQNGSSIIFGGDPNDAQLNLKAVYTVPAVSLSDLNIGNSFSDRTIRANCILNINGTASNPSVNFDLDLPNINDDEKQMVHKLIATEDDLNMQVIHLLTLGRFYTYDYALTDSYTQQSQSTVTANSFLSSTLSNQVNEVISDALGTKGWTFGTNLSTGRTGWSDMEVDGVISGKLLNDRLLLNGNVGYHENQYNINRGSNFVGDFNAQYLLSKNGGIRLKAYSETNDRYFTKSALTTQGFGIQIQKEFNKIKDLFTSPNRKD